MVWRDMSISGLDMEATIRKVSKEINKSGLSDKELGGIMGLSVQSINKWRHGHNLPDIENMFILSRILGKNVDDLLVPLVPDQPRAEVKYEAGQDRDSALCCLKEYAERLKKMFNHMPNYNLNGIS